MQHYNINLTCNLFVLYHDLVAPSLLSVEPLIQNATKYLINNCPLPSDERIKGLISQGNSKASISGVKFNNIVSRLIHFDTFVFHPSE